MTPDEQKKVDAWLHSAIEIQRRGFWMPATERNKYIREIGELLNGKHETSDLVPDWFKRELNSAQKELEAANSAESLALNSDEPNSLPIGMMKAFLATRHAFLLDPVMETMVRGFAKAMDISFEERLRAAETDPVAFDIACDFVSLWLETGSSLPDGWAAFAARVVRGEQKRPRPSRGPKQFVYMHRDGTICSAIELGQALGLDATRSDVSATVSGCDVVAQYLSSHGLFPATFAGVKRVWLDRGETYSAFRRTMKGQLD